MYRYLLEQTRSKIKNVVYSAGGLKGFAYLGAMYELCGHSEEEWQVFCEGLEAVAGTSIGSLAAMATLLAIPIKDLLEFVLAYDFSDLVNKPGSTTLGSRVFSWLTNQVAPTLGSEETRRKTALHQEYYISDGENLSKFFRAFLERFTGDPEITLSELEERTGRTIHLFVCSYYKRQVKDLCPKDFPHLPAWKAMRASSSLPIIFAPVAIADDVYVDGGMMMYTPHYLFNFEETLVLQIDVPPYHASTFGEYCCQVWECLFAGQNEALMLRNPDIWQHLIVVPCTAFTMQDLMANNVDRRLIYQCLKQGQHGVRLYAMRSLILAVIALIMLQSKQKKWQIYPEERMDLFLSHVSKERGPPSPSASGDSEDKIPESK